MAGFYFRDGDGKSYGPFSAQQLKQVAAQGRLTREMDVRKENGDWKPAASVSGLFPAAVDPAPVAPPPPVEEEEPEEIPVRAAVPAATAPAFPEFVPPDEVEDALDTQDEAPVAPRRRASRERSGDQTRFSMLTIVGYIYMALAALAALGGLGSALFFLVLGMGAGREQGLLLAIAPAGGALLVGLLYGAMMLTISEMLRLFVALEANQRIQADLLVDLLERRPS